MRKFISLFAAMLVVLTASAKTWKVSPTHCETEGDQANCNIFRTLKADYTFADGDTLLLAGGNYDETITIAINKSMVVLAAKGEKPVIKLTGYFDVYKSAKFVGVTFDHKDVATNGYAFYFRENTSKYLILEDCEFTGFSSYCVTGSNSSAHCDSLIVNNCYFHDNTKSPIYFPASKLADNVNLCDKVKVTNSTFTNTTGLDGAGIIDNRNNGSNNLETSTMIVDHCTFYNCEGYERIMHAYKSPLFYVSNCIVANPTTPASGTYATYAYGGEVKNCLTFNNSGHRDWDAHPVLTANQVGDPKFVDAANGDYTLGEGSPALTMGTDGGAIGDPRWFPKAPAISAVPTEAAPVPTWPADQVKSLYSDTYTFAPASLNSYNEGWWDFPTLTEETLDGNKFLHYNGRMTGMIGWQFGDIAVSIMEYIHVDIWPSANTTLKMGPTSPNPTVVASVSIAVEAGKWNSIDIPIADLLTAAPTLNLADIFQNQFTEYGALTDLSIDNVYFYRTTPYVDETAPTAFTATLDAASYFGATIKAKATDESGAVAFTVKNGEAIVGTGAAASGVEATINVAGLKAGTKYNLSVIASDDSDNAAEAIAVEVNTLAGPAPAAEPKNAAGVVKSLYSDKYTTATEVNYYQEWWKGAPISTGEIAEGDNVIFYGMAEEGASFGWAFDQIDLSEYPYLHVSIYPLAAGTIEIYPVQDQAASEAPYHRVSATLKANEWNDLVYDFSELDMTKIKQIGWCNYVSAQGFFVDNFYFSKFEFDVPEWPMLNVYASGLKAEQVSGSQYKFSYFLNAQALSGEIQIIGAEDAVVASYPAPAAEYLTKGAHTVSIDLNDLDKGDYKWAVKVKGIANESLARVSDKSERFWFFSPQGLAVDNSYESEYFGRIYVAESRTANTSEQGTRAQKEGIYIFGPALDDVTSQGNNSYNGNAPWNESTAVDANSWAWGMYGPGRLSVADDGCVFICDNGRQSASVNTSGVWMMNPANPSADFKEVLATSQRGTIYNRANSCVAIGSGAEKVLYMIDWSDSIMAFPVGNCETPYANPGTAWRNNLASFNIVNALNTLARGKDGSLWVFQYRGQLDEYPILTHFNAKGERDFWIDKDNNASLAPASNPCRRGSGAVSPDGSKLAFYGNKTVYIYDVAYDENGVPSLSNQQTLAGVGGTNVDAFAFDAANNLYFASASVECFFAYATPKAENQHITPAPSASKIAISDGTAIDNTLQPVKVEKVILNGQVLIIRDGKAYNMMGQIVR